MELECEFCNKSFSTTSNLRYHKKTSKRCQEIQIQNKDKIIEIESSFVNCEFCNKIFTSQILKTHHKNCKKKIEYEIKNLLERLNEKDEENKRLLNEKDEENKRLLNEKDEENKRLLNEKDEENKRLLNEKDEENKRLLMRILELEAENKIYSKDHDFIKIMASQSKNTTTNKIKINNNFFDNPERIKKMIDEKLNKDYVSDGQKGVAQFAYDTLLKDNDGNKNYICSDPSRHIFKFQNSEGNIEKDIKAVKLTNMLIDAGITSKSGSIAPSLWTDEDGSLNVNKFQAYGPYTSQISTMQLDNSVFRNELACLTSL